jgi:hypothetical protein
MVGGNYSTVLKTGSLPSDTRKINLTANEIYEMEYRIAKSHPIERHIGKDVRFLANRANSLPRGEASSFHDIETYLSFVNHSLDKNHIRIKSWLSDTGSPRLELDMSSPTGKSLGYIVRRNSSHPISSTKGKIVLQKDSNGGYHILTSYLTQ